MLSQGVPATARQCMLSYLRVLENRYTCGDLRRKDDSCMTLSLTWIDSTEDGILVGLRITIENNLNLHVEALRGSLAGVIISGGIPFKFDRFFTGMYITWFGTHYLLSNASVMGKTLLN